MASLYSTYQPAIQPPFAQGPYGQRWGAAFGNVKDQAIQRLKLGVLSRFINFSPVDAIGELAQERKMFQGTGESLAHFEARLLNAWGAWSIGGTYWGLLAQLFGAGYTTAYIVASNGYIYGPSNGVLAPDPINGVAGTPPAYQRLPPWYTSGSAATNMEWQASTAYALNSIVTPVSQNGTYFLAIQGGTSGSSQPTWPGVGGKVTDGGVTWLYLGNYNNQAVYPPWTFGTADGQGDPGTITLDIEQSLVGIGGPPAPTGAFWSRFIVMFDPVPTSWTDIVNPPVGTSDPSSAEISVLQEIIANFKPGKSTCVGILGLPSGLTRACWGFPLTTTTNIPFSCFLSRAIATGDAPNSTAFVATRPQSVYSWLPNTAVANAGGSTYIFTTPSSAKLNGYLYSSPASSGTTGFTEPTWPTSLGGTVTDNGITWTCIATLYEWSQQQGDTIFAF